MSEEKITTTGEHVRCAEPSLDAEREAQFGQVVDWIQFDVDSQKRVHVKLQLLSGKVFDFRMEPLVAHDAGSKLISASAHARLARQQGGARGEGKG